MGKSKTIEYVWVKGLFSNLKQRPLDWFLRKYPTLEAQVRAIEEREAIPVDAARMEIPIADSIDFLRGRLGQPLLPRTPSPTPSDAATANPAGTAAEGSEQANGLQQENLELRREIQQLKEALATQTSRNLERVGLGAEPPIADPSPEPGEDTSTNGRSTPAKRKVFLSYFREDLDQARRLYDSLDRDGFEVWWDQLLLGGDRWRDKIDAALERSDYVVLVLSKEGTERERSGVYVEVWKAISRYLERRPGTRYLIPVRLSKCNLRSLRFESIQLSEFQYIDLFPEKNWEPGYERLLRSLGKSPD